MAFNWSAPTSSLTDFNYQIDVMKFTSSTAAFGSASFQADDAATAVNGAPVYFAIKLVVPSDVDDDVEANAKVDVKFTAIDGMKGKEKIDISNLSAGTYYYYDATGTFQPIEFFRANVYGMNYIAETPVYAKACLDTDTAKVEAKVYSNRPLGKWFTVGGYDIGKTYAVAAGTQDNALVANAITAIEQGGTGPVYGTFQTGRSFVITFANALVYQPGSITYTIGGVSATIDIAPNQDATYIARAVAAKLGSPVRININGQNVLFNLVINGTMIGFTEVSETASNGALQYANLGSALPAVSATMGDATGGVKVVEFREAAEPIGSGDLVAVLPLNSSDRVLAIIGSAAEATSYKTEGGDPIQVAYGGNAPWAGTAATIDLLEWLDDGNAGSFKDAVVAGQVYMTDDNMRAAFGFANSVSDSITWQANSTPIILDPTVSIPKTGDNASVIGFAMIMAAVVLAAVAVKKVKA